MTRGSSVVFATPAARAGHVRESQSAIRAAIPAAA